MDFELTEMKKQILTEFVLKECWHEKLNMASDGSILRCTKCNKLIRWDESESFRRNFTKPDDVYSLVKSISSMYLWAEFEDFLVNRFPLMSKGTMFTSLFVENYIYENQNKCSLPWLIAAWAEDKIFKSKIIY